jgi:hypothetical protein
MDDKLGGRVACVEGKINIYNILVRKANGKTPFVKHMG